MLTLITGRAGTGKTAELLSRLCGNRGTGRRQICLVPEPYSHEMERRLCQAGGDSTSLYAEVLTFTALYDRVFDEAGRRNLPLKNRSGHPMKKSTPLLDRGGRLLRMHQALQQVESRLTFYRSTSRQDSFLNSLTDTLDELKSRCICPEDLSAAAELRPEDADKLRDLGLIYSAYEALTARDAAADPGDRLTRLDLALQDCPYFENTDVFVDCFETFSAQEMNVLDRILHQASSLTVAIPCGDRDLPERLPEFASADRTIDTLLERAGSAGVEVRIENRSGQNQNRAAELCGLEEAWLTRDSSRLKEAGPDSRGAVELCTAGSPFEEVEYAAGKILDLVRKKGWRWRDIGVAVPDMDSWVDEIEAAFRRYGIPVSRNRRTDILQKPAVVLVTSALNAVNRDFRCEDLLWYLKTGLISGICPEDLDLLENYVLMWEIQGEKQWNREWNRDTGWNPDGFAEPWTPEGEALLERLNSLRSRIIRPLMNLKERGSAGRTGLDQASAVYGLLREIRLKDRLEEQAALCRKNGEPGRAAEYAQLWNCLCSALDQCARLLKTEPLSLAGFSRLFQLVLRQYRADSTPVSLDGVMVGEAGRMPHRRLKGLIILGADEGCFPRTPGPSGLLTDEDREVLSGYGLDIRSHAAETREEEQSLLYRLISLPGEFLAVCHASRSGIGEEQQPSLLYSRLAEDLPASSRVTADNTRRQYRLSSPVPALDELAETRSPSLLADLKKRPDMADRAARLERSFRWERGSLSYDKAEKLYTRNIHLSATRVDDLKKCHFSYFLKYGLKLRPRKPAEFNALKSGNFIHDVLEYVLSTAEKNGGVKQCDEETIERWTAEAEDRYLENLNGLKDSDRRFRYLYERQRPAVDRTVLNVAEELKRSEFRPCRFELPIGDGENNTIRRQVKAREGDPEGELTLSLSGRIDRVDTWEKDGKLYYRVIDYKTGKKGEDPFSYTNVWSGLDLQMLIYLYALEDNGREELGADGTEELIPAGVLYVPVGQATVDGRKTGMDRDKLEKEAARNRKRRGLLLYDPEVLAAMEHGDGKNYTFLPISTRKKDEYLATGDQLEMLQHHIDRILDDAGRELLSGNVDADPCWQGGKLPCEHCDFAAACQFEEGRKGKDGRIQDRRRSLPPLDKDAFWAKIKEEEKSGTSGS